MRRKTLLTLALAMLLVVPAVMAMASTGFEKVGTIDTITAQVREQAQDRDCGECVNDQSATPAVVGQRDQIRSRDQLQTQDPDLDQARDQTQARDRDQVRDETNCDGDALQLRKQVRTEAQLETNLAGRQGEQKGIGPGAETGNGPVHEGPADGTGNQFGRNDG
jgi:hypothetical protein